MTERNVAVQVDGEVKPKAVEIVYEKGIWFVHQDPPEWEKVASESPERSWPNDNAWVYKRGKTVVWKSRGGWMNKLMDYSAHRYSTLKAATNNANMRGDYVVTHAPTGLAIHRCRSKAEATKLCSRLDHHGPLVGTELKFGTVPEDKKTVEVMEEIKKVWRLARGDVE